MVLAQQDCPSHLQKSIDKIARQPRLGLLLRAEILQHMALLLPEVERLLELLVRLEQQHVDGLQLVDEAVSLEFLPYLGAQRGDGEVEGVHGLDFGGLEEGLLVDWMGQLSGLGAKESPGGMHLLGQCCSEANVHLLALSIVSDIFGPPLAHCN